MARSLTNLCRSFMYVPGDKMKMIEKIISLKANQAPDIAVFDCEDGVGYNNKSKARENILTAVEEGKLGKCRHSNVCIRINAISNKSLFDDDLKFVIECLKASNYVYPQMINLPKVETLDDAEFLDTELRKNIDYCLLPAPIGLSLMIESCRAVVNLAKFCRDMESHIFACFVPYNIVFGSDDYCASLGVSRSSDNTEVLFARQLVATVSRAYGISAIDMVDIDLSDLDRLESNCRVGAGLGFLGKQVVHPSQLAVVHSAFSSPSSRLEWASALLQEQLLHQQRGEGVFVFRGQMVDRPTVLQAENVVKLANLIDTK